MQRTREQIQAIYGPSHHQHQRSYSHGMERGHGHRRHATVSHPQQQPAPIHRGSPGFHRRWVDAGRPVPSFGPDGNPSESSGSESDEPAYVAARAVMARKRAGHAHRADFPRDGLGSGGRGAIWPQDQIPDSYVDDPYKRIVKDPNQKSLFQRIKKVFTVSSKKTPKWPPPPPPGWRPPPPRRASAPARAFTAPTNDTRRPTKHPRPHVSVVPVPTSFATTFNTNPEDNVYNGMPGFSSNDALVDNSGVPLNMIQNDPWFGQGTRGGRSGRSGQRSGGGNPGWEGLV